MPVCPCTLCTGVVDDLAGRRHGETGDDRVRAGELRTHGRGGRACRGGFVVGRWGRRRGAARSDARVRLHARMAGQETVSRLDSHATSDAMDIEEGHVH